MNLENIALISMSLAILFLAIAHTYQQKVNRLTNQMLNLLWEELNNGINQRNNKNKGRNKENIKQ